MSLNSFRRNSSRVHIESLESRQLLTAYTFGDFSTVVDGPQPAMVDVRGQIYLATNSGLYRTDGSASGTTLAQAGVATKLFAFNDALYYVAVAPTGAGDNRFRKLGTHAGNSVSITAAGTGIRTTDLYFPNGNKLYFVAESGAGTGIHALTEGATDASFIAAGTPLGFKSSTLFYSSTVPGTPSSTGLWKFDGTTSVVVASNFRTDYSMQLGSDLIIEGEFGTGERGLWRINSSGQLEQFSSITGLRQSIQVENKLYFVTIGRKLYQTDGTSTGTQLVAPIVSGDLFKSGKFASIGDTLYFVGVSETIGAPQLFATEGPGTTRQITEFTKDGFNGALDGVVTGGGKIFFAGREGTSYYELWETDGSIGSASRVAGFAGYSNSFENAPQAFTYANGALFAVQPLGYNQPQRLWRNPVESIVLKNGVLAVNGIDSVENPSANDSLVVTTNGVTDFVTLNGQTTGFAHGSIDRLVFNAFDGDDSLSIANEFVPDVIYNADGGIESFAYTYSAATTQLTLTSNGFTSSTINRALHGIDSLALTTSGMADAVAVTGNATPLTLIDTAGGDDRIDVALGNGSLSGITLNGGSGNDLLAFDESQATAGHKYEFNDSVFSRDNLPTPTLAQFENVQLQAGSGDDQFLVKPNAGTTYAINGGAPAYPALTSPGDVLLLNTSASATRTVSGTGAGTLSFSTAKPIIFSNVETVDDQSAPAVTSASFEYGYLNETVTFFFSEPIKGLTFAKLQLLNADTNQPIPGLWVTSSFDYVRNAAVFTLSSIGFNPSNSPFRIPGGNYKATLLAAGLTDLAGTPLAANYVHNFPAVRGPTSRAYYVNPATLATISAAGSTGNIVKYEWDLNYGFQIDEPFDVDATGFQVNYDSTGRLNLPDTIRIALRMTDSAGNQNVEPGAIVFNNTAPTADFRTENPALVGNPVSFNFANPFDPLLTDSSAGFRYFLDLNNDGDFLDATDANDVNTAVINRTFTSVGTFNVRGRIMDRRGAFNDYVIPVNVTAGGSSIMLAASADAYVRDGSNASTNFGTATNIDVKKDGVGFNREGYFTFDISTLSNPTNVKFRINGKLTTTMAGGINAALHGVADTSWTENGLTFANKPAAASTAIATVNIPGTTAAYYEFDVTSYIQQQKALGKNAVSFNLKALNSGAAMLTFNSKNAATNQPQLVATTPSAAPQAIVVSANSVNINEGTTGGFMVRLATAPTSTVIVTATRTGDATLGNANRTYFFTPTNWFVPQNYTIAAAEDSDTVNSSATFTLASTNLANQVVSVTAVDNDTPPPPTNFTLNALADAHVRGGINQTKNYGTSTTLEVKKDGLDNLRETYLKFDLSTISSASNVMLRLFGRISDPVAGGIGISIYDVANSGWDESTLTYANRPATATNALATFTVTGTTSQWYEINLSAWAAAQKSAGKTEGTLVLKSLTSGALATFNARTAATNSLQMVVTNA